MAQSALLSPLIWTLSHRCTQVMFGHVFWYAGAHTSCHLQQTIMTPVFRKQSYVFVGISISSRKDRKCIRVELKRWPK